MLTLEREPNMISSSALCFSLSKRKFLEEPYSGIYLKGSNLQQQGSQAMKCLVGSKLCHLHKCAFQCFLLHITRM